MVKAPAALNSRGSNPMPSEWNATSAYEEERGGNAFEASPVKPSQAKLSFNQL